jgi:dTDP-4-dehydrorhamnose reductase
MKILLFGKDGQLGWELERSLAPVGEVIAFGRAGRDGLGGDFLQPQAVAATVRSVRPDLVVNAAAFTAVDAAEQDRDTAALVNAIAPAQIAQAAHGCGARVLHFSTEHVFDGSGRRPWTEEDLAEPVNEYGRSKRDGEVEVARACPQHLVVRTSWLYGGRRSNFLTRILDQAVAGAPLAVVDDQVGAPTSAALLADVAAHMVRAWTADAALAGTYHATAAGETSRYECARFLLAQAADLGLVRGGIPVQAVSSSGRPTQARRPANSRLDTTRLRETFQLALPDWQDGISRTLREIAQARHIHRAAGGWP